VGVLVGELYAATAGIGFMITVAGATFQTDKVFVGVLIFAISGMIGMEFLTKLERKVQQMASSGGIMRHPILIPQAHNGGAIYIEIRSATKIQIVFLY
jgi:hypothetical protein